MVNVILAAVAGGFGLLGRILALGRAGRWRWTELRLALLQVSAYVSVVAMLEVLAHFEPAMEVGAQLAAWTMVAGEIASGIGDLAKSELIGNGVAQAVGSVLGNGHAASAAGAAATQAPGTGAAANGAAK